MKIFVLTTYQYSAYSWDGLSEGESYYFKTFKSAEEYAVSLKLKVVNNAERDTEATISQATLND